MTTLERTITVRKRLGLHVRPATEITQQVYDFDAIVEIIKGDKSAYAHSVVELMMLGVYDGDELRVTGIGNEAEEAMNAVIGLLTVNE